LQLEKIEKAQVMIMSKKPTYEELEEKVKELEREAVKVKRAEDTLKISEEKFAKAFHNGPALMTISSIEDGKYLEVNENFLRVTGYSKEESVGTTSVDLGFISKKDRDRLKQELMQNGRVDGMELMLNTKDGDSLYCLYYGEIITVAGEQRLLSITGDITERKRAEEALKENEAHLRTLIRTIPDLVWLKDRQGIYLSCNSRFESFFGAKEKDIIGKTDYDFVDKELADFFRKHDKVAMAKGKPSSNEEEVTFAYDGHRELLETIKTPMYRSDGQLAGVLGIGRDITEKKQVSEQIRSLSHALLTTQESERLKISRELHDGLVQDLIVSKLHCDIIAKHSLLGQPIPGKSLKIISDILKKCISAVRQMVYDLRPSDLIEFGIVETLRQYCLYFSEIHMIPIDFQATGFEKITISDEISINIYRMVQEGLNNIMKHAAASQVLIRVLAAFPYIILRIEDNGKGFDVHKRQAFITEEKKLGLRSMQERVDLLGGSMKIDSKPSFGTKLFIKILYGEQTYGLEKNYIDR
jgi:PAS domain S-box-containing protein